MKKNTKRNILTLGAIVSLSLAASPALMANPFQSTSLRNGNLLAENTTTKPADAKCGSKMKDGKCGAKGMAESKPADGKCGAKMKDGKCGSCAESKSKDSKSDAKCAESKSKDAKCGQGTCGSKKK